MAPRIRRPVRESPPDDPQQYLLYRMEHEAIGARTYSRISRAGARKLARSVCRHYRIPQVELRWADLGRWAAEWDNGVITFNSKKGTARDLITLVHEVAHHLHYHVAPGGGETQQVHGREFMACYMGVFDTCRIMPVVAMKAVCDKYGIEYNDPGGTKRTLIAACK